MNLSRAINYSTALSLNQPLYVKGPIPLDCRYVVKNVSEIINPNNKKDTSLYKALFSDGKGGSFYYTGMQVFAEDTLLIYILKYDEAVNDSYFVELKTGSDIDIESVLNNKDFITGTTLTTKLSEYAKKDDITGLYKIKEPLDDIDDLHALKVDDVSVGDVHNIRDRFTIEVELSDGGKQLRTYPSGTNVVCFRIDEVEDPTDSTKKIKTPRWDALGGVSEFDWIDVTEESEEPEESGSGTGTDPGVLPTLPTT